MKGRGGPLLLDTHVIIWLFEGVDRLSRRARTAIDGAAQRGQVFVSAISFWEIAMLGARGRLSLSGPLAEWRNEVLRSPGVRELPVDGDVAIAAVGLPGAFHPDPADRLLVATARTRDLRLVTADTRILAYAAAGNLAALEA